LNSHYKDVELMTTTWASFSTENDYTSRLWRESRFLSASRQSSPDSNLFNSGNEPCIKYLLYEADKSTIL